MNSFEIFMQLFSNKIELSFIKDTVDEIVYKYTDLFCQEL